MTTIAAQSAGFCLFATLSLAPAAAAQTYSYPELMVVPRATQTLRNEERVERSNTFSRYLPMQLSAVATIVAGYKATGEETPDNPKHQNEITTYGKTAIGVGVTFLGVTTLAGLMTTPYRTGMLEVAKIKGQSQADQLARERAAEEALENAGGFARNLSYLSVAANFFINVGIAAESDDETVKQIAVCSALAALIPYFFEPRAESVINRQNDYKKRIYGPITSLGFYQSPQSGKFGPMLTWQLAI